MKKIAIIRRNGLGDLLCVYPLVAYFQKYEPATEITLFIDKRNAPLISYLPAVAEVVILPHTGNKYWNLWKVARKYRKKFDVVFSGKTSPMKLMNFFLYMLQPKKSIAYVDSAWHSKLVSNPITFDPKKLAHQALKGLWMVRPDLKSVPVDLYPKIELLEKKEVDSPLLLLSATTTREASRLDEKRYAHLANTLGMRVLIIGQKCDAKRAQEIAKHLHVQNSVHFPESFEEFMVFLNTADMYFVGDGGIAHIGAALGKKGVVLYGQTNPAEWHPLSKKMKTLYHPDDVNKMRDEIIAAALNEVYQ